MQYDFDKVIDRRGTMSLKFDQAKERGHREDELPLWVADMDFPTAAPVIEALRKEALSGIYGYSEPDEGYFAAVAGWMKKHYDWETDRKWIVKTPGIVMALALAVRAYSKPGDAVLIQQPVYYPYSEVIRDNGRRIVSNTLKLVPARSPAAAYFDGRIRDYDYYEIDFEDFERQIAENHVPLYLLCSPHNPVGRVWTAEELRRMGEICRKYGTVVVSDEIHADFVLPGKRHHVFQEVDPSFRAFTVTCTSPTKTFNMASLQISNIFIPNDTLRRKFRHELDAAGYSQCGVFGLVGCKAAYAEGEEWYEQLMTYLVGNISFFRDFLASRLPELKLIEPEGTYLLWVDCRGLGLPDAELNAFIRNKAKLWLDAGNVFGAPGEGFERFNVACPRVVLQRALEQLEAAVIELRKG